MTRSLLNCADIVERITTIETVKDGEGMIATHSCKKTYFVKNRVGEMVSITNPAIFVKGLPQDLLSGKAVNGSRIRIVLDEDSDVSGLFPLDGSNEVQYQDSIPFIGEPTDLFYLQTESMDWTTFERMTGYNLWHRRLGHTPNRFIKLSIEHSIGLEKLRNKKFSEHQICPSCMIGKSQLNEAESGMAGRFWFSASNHGKTCRNVTFKQRLGTTPHAKIYGEKADVSNFRPFGCRAYVHLNKDRREPGKHTPRVVEAIHLGFASDSNMSAYKFYIPSTGQLMYSNHAKLVENFCPYQNKDMIEGHLADGCNVDILSELQKDVTVLLHGLSTMIKSTCMILRKFT